jgi:hypothetical protein
MIVPSRPWSGVWLSTLGPAWYERVVNERLFQFDWDEAKADANARKHGVTFELASTVLGLSREVLPPVGRRRPSASTTWKVYERSTV